MKKTVDMKEKISDLMSDISIKKELRNHILKIISKYKKTDNLIPDSELLSILMSAALANETVYIRALLNKCKKNISPQFIDLFEEYLEEAKNGPIINLNDVECPNQKYADATGDAVTFEVPGSYDDERGLYTFNYVAEEGDTFSSLCEKFNLPVNEQDIQNEELVVGDVLTLFTDDETLAKYQQIIFECFTKKRSSR